MNTLVGRAILTDMRKGPVLCAVDFSRASLAALSEAIWFARSEARPLVLVHVLPPPIPPDSVGYVPVRMYEEMESAVRQHAAKREEKLAAAAGRKGVRCRALLVKGVPHEEIVRAARLNHAGMIVIGTHGRTGLAKLLMGSVAARVVGTAPCPVLTVRRR